MWPNLEKLYRSSPVKQKPQVAIVVVVEAAAEVILVEQACDKAMTGIKI